MKNHLLQYEVDNPDKMKTVLTVLKAMGFLVDMDGEDMNETVKEYAAFPWLVINLNERSVGGNSAKVKGLNDCEMMNDLFHAIVHRAQPIEVELTKEYTAIVGPDEIQVGCQHISYEAFDRVCAAVAKVREA